MIQNVSASLQVYFKFDGKHEFEWKLVLYSGHSQMLNLNGNLIFRSACCQNRNSFKTWMEITNNAKRKCFKHEWKTCIWMETNASLQVCSQICTLWKTKLWECS